MLVSLFIGLCFRSNCTDGYLKIFLKGQETQDAYDKFDYELCGNDTPSYVVSDGPRLAMVFSSGEIQARGFKVICIENHTKSNTTFILLTHPHSFFLLNPERNIRVCVFERRKKK